MIKPNTKRQLKKLVRKDADFCVAPAAGNSMDEMCKRHPGEWPIALAARSLVLSEDEYKQVYVDAVLKIRETMAVDTDAEIV